MRESERERKEKLENKKKIIKKKGNWLLLKSSLRYTCSK